MKRYLLFEGYDYEANGGFDDFAGSFDTIKKARNSSTNEWYHIVDSKTWEKVFDEYGKIKKENK